MLHVICQIRALGAKKRKKATEFDKEQTWSSQPDFSNISLSFAVSSNPLSIICTAGFLNIKEQYKIWDNINQLKKQRNKKTSPFTKYKFICRGNSDGFHCFPIFLLPQQKKRGIKKQKKT